MEIKNNDIVYLKKNVAPEPLFMGWYAWSHLISPATAAFNIKNRHLKIMESYIQNPAIHMAAVKSPKMRGGPFIDHNGERVDEIKNLFNKTINEQKSLLDLEEAITDLNSLLLKEANGYSLEPLYEKIPEKLKGLVELFYDLNNQPNFRFFEKLLYSEYYDKNYQCIDLHLINADDSRSFILSTPRLKEKNSLRLDIPFAYKGIDELFRMQRTPRPLHEIKEILSIDKEEEKLFNTFFTTEKQNSYEPYVGDGIRTKYFGHACVLIETKDVSILVDPVISYGYESDISRLTYDDLPDEIDFVLITHNHQDHILIETLIQLRYKIKNIIVPRSGMGDLQDPSLKLMFENIGFNNIIEFSEFEKMNYIDCEIIGLPFLGEHSDVNIRAKLCWYIKLKNNFRLFFAADSCNIEPRVYKKVQELYGNVDVLFLGMECDGAPLSWLYGALLFEDLERDKDQSRRLAGSNYERAKSFVDCFKPKDVFVYAMGLEPWLEYISSIKYTDESRPIIDSNKLIKYCIDNKMVAERLYGEKIIEYK